MRVIDLDALTSADRLPRVRLFGRDLTVFPLTGSAAHRLATLQDEDTPPSAMLGPLIELVATMVPDLTREERDRLTVDQLAALLQLSRGQIGEVEAMIAAQAEATTVSAGAEGNGPLVSPTG